MKRLIITILTAAATYAFAGLPMNLTLADKALAGTTIENMEQVIQLFAADDVESIQQMISNGEAEMIPAGAHIVLQAMDEEHHLAVITYKGLLFWVAPEVINKALKAH